MICVAAVHAMGMTLVFILRFNVGARCQTSQRYATRVTGTFSLRILRCILIQLFHSFENKPHSYA